MGIFLSAICSCSYSETVAIGSNMHKHGKVFLFPHFCNHCVNVVSKDIYFSKTLCPLCDNDEIFSYTATTNTLKPSSFFNYFSSSFLQYFGFHKITDVEVEIYAFRFDRKFTLLNSFHYCPKCKKNSLKFSGSALFD